MFHFMFHRWLAPACMIVLAAMSTGCMLEPQHGDYVPNGSPVKFLGLATHPDARIRIEALDPDLGWTPLATTTPTYTTRVVGTPSNPYDSSGCWHVWEADVFVPDDCWTFHPSECREAATLRAVEVDDRGGVVGPVATFEDFDWMLYVAMTDPIFARMTPVDVFDRWGHGDTLTVYRFAPGVYTPPRYAEYREDPW